MNKLRFTFLISLLSVVLFSFSSCNNDDSINMNDSQASTVADLRYETGRHSECSLFRLEGTFIVPINRRLLILKCSEMRL